MADKDDYLELKAENERLKKQIDALQEELKEAKLNHSSTSRKRSSPLDKAHATKKPKIEPTVSSTLFSTYEKRQGTVDQGKEYERLMCGFYALKLATNDEVLDFKMTTNNNKCGIFDDIDIDVTFKNGKRQIFLFQLKHKEREECITHQMLTQKIYNKKNKLYLLDYLHGILELKSNNLTASNEDVKFILYTNSPTNIERNPVLCFYYGPLLAAETCDNLEHKKLITNTKVNCEGSSVFRLKLVKHGNLDLEQACQQMYFFTKQKNLHEVTTEVEKMLKTLLHTDIFDSFDYFIKVWWSDNFVLNKHDIIAKLVELTLSPYITTVTGSKCNKKTEQFVMALMKFDVTIMNCQQEDVITSIWSAADEAFDMTNPMKKFGLMTEELSLVQRAKILWYLGKVPLFVKIDDFNKEIVKSVLKVLDRYPLNKKIVLMGNISICDYRHLDVFTNFSDLVVNCGNEDFYQHIIRDFKVSLQGRGSLSLEEMIAVNKEVTEVIKPRELLKMTHLESLVIGTIGDTVSGIHLTRNVLPASFRTTSILSYCESTRDCVVIFNCDQKFQELLHLQNQNCVEISEYLSQEDYRKYEHSILLSVRDKCTTNHFELICCKTAKSEVYLFEIMDNDRCTLLLRQGDKLLQKKYIQKERLIKEENIFHCFDYPLNVVCAPPGMGKSTLFHVLNKCCPRDFWSVHVNLINYNPFLRTKPNKEKLLFRFLESSYSDSTSSKISKLFWEKRRIYFFLDGLDEIDYVNVGFVLDFVKYILAEGACVWLSSRENLYGKFLFVFNIVPIKIQEFTQEQQTQYIDLRLRTKYQDIKALKKVQDMIFNSADVTNSRNLLAIPLQLYIITETFLINEDAFKILNEENIFVLTKMYSLFFDGKKKFSFQKVGVEQQEEQLPFFLEQQLKVYQIPALQSCLDDTDFQELNPSTDDNKVFMKKFKVFGDKLGIIKQVTDEDAAIFDHQTYAEYFACIWLKEHPEKIFLLREKFFSERYQNLRLIFDIMVAEKHPLHLAVIYKNVEQFGKYRSSTRSKDEGGRTALHLACSYGMKYTKERIRHTTDQLNRESKDYIEIVDSLIQCCDDIYELDNLFGLDCINYSVNSLCLYSVEKMLEITLVAFEVVYSTLLNYIDDITLVYYCSRLGYFNLLSGIIKKNPKIINMKIHEMSLLQAAVMGSNEDQCFPPRKGNIAAVDVLIRNGADVGASGRTDTNILEYACKNNYYDMVEVLVHHDAKCNDGNTALHVLAFYGVINNYVIAALSGLNIDLNAQNYEGRTALYNSIYNGKVENAKYLLSIGADANIVDCKYANTLHTAANIVEYYPQTIELISVLIEHGIPINAKDIHGRTALHFACKSSFEVAEMLIDEGADINAFDDYGKNGLHYAAGKQHENVQLIQLLVARGFDVNSRTIDGMTALQLACQQRQFQNIKTLIEFGACVNSVDLCDMNSLHYVMDSFNPNSELNPEIVHLLLSNGVNLNSQNEDGVTALCFACKYEQLECLKILLDREASVDIVDNEGNTVLHYAAKSLNNSTNIIDLVMKYVTDINSRNKKGATPLQLACQNGITANIKKFIEMGADVRMLDYEDNTVLHYLAHSSNDTNEIVDFIVKNYDMDLNFPNSEGTTMLHITLRTYQDHHLDKMENLLSSGARLDVVDKNHLTALHYAVQSQADNTEVISFLVEAGLDVKSRTKDTQTAVIHLACKESEVESVRKLIDYGADVNAVDCKNRTTLHYAAQAKSLNTITINLLKNSGVNVNGVDSKGRTPLHLACRNLHLRNLQQLIEQGADLNMVDNDGNNALHYAAQSKTENTEIINILIQRGLDVNLSNNFDETPLHVCCKNGNWTDIDKLIKYGADFKKVTCEGRNVLHYATFSKNSEVIFSDALLKLRLDINARDIRGASVLHLACAHSDCDTVKLLIGNSADIHLLDNHKRSVLHYAALAKIPDPHLIQVLIDSEIDVKREDLDGNNALDFAIKNDCFGAIKVLIEKEVFCDILNPSDDIYLYYSIYSGCSYGVELFFKNNSFEKIDLNNTDFPVIFPMDNERLSVDKMRKMTLYIGRLIAYLNEEDANIKYSHNGLTEFLKVQFSENNNFVFNDADDQYVINKTCKNFRAFLLEFHKA